MSNNSDNKQVKNISPQKEYVQRLQSLIPSASETHEAVWKGANFFTIAGTTSLAIAFVQSPVKSIILNLTMNGTLIPAFNGGLLGLAKAMYAGTFASLGGSTARTIYVTGAKNIKPGEERTQVKEEQSLKEERSQNKFSNFTTIATIALGEIGITNISESLSSLKKIPGLLPADFKWSTPHNAARLLTGGFIPRFGSGMINFSALCVLEGKISGQLSFQDKKLVHFTAGALSGVTAAVCSYPLNAFKDYVQVQSSVKDGKLYNKSAFSAAQELFYSFRTNPLASLKSLGVMSAKQLPIRMGLTGIIFGIVAGVGETLGQEPLKKIVSEKYQPSAIKSGFGFFAQPEHSKVEENDHVVSEKPAGP